MSSENSLVSVVVPVYNVEKYLFRAIDSVLYQSYQNFEVILVDDGSADSSGVLCDEAREKDARVRVIHQENAGVSSARNVGIAAASGEYLFFLDPDDTIERETIQCMLETMKDKQCDLVICGVKKIFVDEDGETVSEQIICLSEEGFYSNIDLIMKLRSGNIVEVDSCASACNRLYKKSSFASLQEPFPADIAYCEDVYFSIDLLNVCDKIYFIKKPFYNYYRYDVKIRKSSMNSHVKNRFEIYKRIHLRICQTILHRVSEAQMKLCKHNFIDRVILACVKLCSFDSPYTKEEIVKQLNSIVHDESVINAMTSYDRKVKTNWTNSWTIPLLIQLKNIEYLMYFAGKVAREKSRARRC